VPGRYHGETEAWDTELARPNYRETAASGRMRNQPFPGSKGPRAGDLHSRQSDLLHLAFGIPLLFHSIGVVMMPS
jgi:hypothetical protein